MRMIHSCVVLAVAVIVATIPDVARAQDGAPPGPVPVVIGVGAKDPGTPFPHFWEQMFGSGRAGCCRCATTRGRSGS